MLPNRQSLQTLFFFGWICTAQCMSLSLLALQSLTLRWHDNRHVKIAFGRNDIVIVYGLKIRFDFVCSLSCPVYIKCI